MRVGYILGILGWEGEKERKRSEREYWGTGELGEEVEGGVCPNYRKIQKISPGTYIFQRPFLRGLSTKGNLRFKIDWTSLIVGSEFNRFCFVLLCI